MKKHIHVAVAVVYSSASRILLSKRPDHLHQGGLWEFPGGKVEANESTLDALNRELLEELDISIGFKGGEYNAEPLIRIKHDYGDKQVLLDVWNVFSFDGEPYGREGQEVRWVGRDDLSQYAFPAANRPIVQACQLSREIAITRDLDSIEAAKIDVSNLLAKAPSALVLRMPSLLAKSPSDYQLLVEHASSLCANVNIKLLVHNALELACSDGIAGIHMSFIEAQSHRERPVSESKLFGVSCHSESEVLHAQKLHADYIFLSPVNATSSHPGQEPKGWEWFAAMADLAVVPVYALGGVNSSHVKSAINNGGQGVAGISSWL